MRCFFLDPDTIRDNTLHITGQEARHIASVLRLSPGVELKLFDGSGRVILGKISHVCRRDITVEILSSHISHPVAPSLTLCQSMLKGKKMDFIIQKANELGVETFIPLITQFCENHTVKHDRQLVRWKRIIIESCKQCQRPVPMRVSPPTPLDRIPLPEKANLIMAWEDECSQSLQAELIKPKTPTLLLIGPEGGFHRDEVIFCHNCGFITVSLGALILRAETAAVTITAIVQHINGHLHPLPLSSK